MRARRAGLLTGSQIQTTASQGPGACILANLAPGPYRVIALDKYIQMDGSDSAKLAQFLSLGKEVTIEAGGVVNLELDLIRTGGADAPERTTP